MSTTQSTRTTTTTQIIARVGGIFRTTKHDQYGLTTIWCLFVSGADTRGHAQVRRGTADGVCVCRGVSRPSDHLFLRHWSDGMCACSGESPFLQKILSIPWDEMQRIRFSSHVPFSRIERLETGRRAACEGFHEWTISTIFNIASQFGPRK